MITENFKKALKILSERFEKSKLKWALIGSTNMALQGMDVSPHDIDIIVNVDDFGKTRNAFSDLRPSPAEKSKYGGLKFKLVIEGVEIEIIGEGRNDGVYIHSLLENKLTYIDVDGTKIPCFRLEVEAEAYSKTNREEKAGMIRKFIEESR